MKNCTSISTFILQKVNFSNNLEKNIYDAKMQSNYKTLLSKLIYLIV